MPRGHCRSRSEPSYKRSNLQMNPGRAFVLAAILLTLIGCGGGGGGNGLNLSRVHVDSGRVARSNIGPGGGMITARGANGNVYTLTIPADSLLLPTDISMYPVKSIDGLAPESRQLTSGFAGGVHFTPEGLIFN